MPRDAGAARARATRRARVHRAQPARAAGAHRPHRARAARAEHDAAGRAGRRGRRCFVDAGRDGRATRPRAMTEAGATAALVRRAGDGSASSPTPTCASACSPRAARPTSRWPSAARAPALRAPRRPHRRRGAGRPARRASARELCVDRPRRADRRACSRVEDIAGGEHSPFVLRRAIAARRRRGRARRDGRPAGLPRAARRRCCRPGWRPPTSRGCWPSRATRRRCG